ncbi:MAG: hypothetical protein H6Q55_2611 [Deltaproteobacteria bacterium]|jgi:hypothetical protein|nr:hypothetical protein [Deltaproteobacteria bacterium]
MADETLSTQEAVAKTRTYGQFRCLNPSCTARLSAKPGQKTVKCERCNSEWRVAWVKEGFPRVRGPVWETSERLAEEAMKAKMAKKEEK